MKFDELLDIVGDEPIFTTGMLLAGNVKRADVHKQLSRWVKAGKLLQFRRGVYAFEKKRRAKRIDHFVVANLLYRDSYVSCQSALSYYGLIPEYVPVTVSICRRHPKTIHTPIGKFMYRHIGPFFYSDFSITEVAPAQHARIATPEKALLDMLYLHPGSDSIDYLRELRLEDVDGKIDIARLKQLAEKSESQKLIRCAKGVEQVLAENPEYETFVP
jgi:predicted transcriptional regulator of viral defense system